MLPTVPLATDRGARAHTVDVGQVPIEFRVGKFTNFTGLYSYSADGMQIGPCGVVRAQAAAPPRTRRDHSPAHRSRPFPLPAKNACARPCPATE
jgi:hypothetical protein